MTDPLEKESSDKAQQFAPCPRCGKPFAKSLKFTLSSWFQTDPGDGLSRWQECCKCDIKDESDLDDLPFSEEIKAAGEESELESDRQSVVAAAADGPLQSQRSPGVDEGVHEEVHEGVHEGVPLDHPADPPTMEAAAQEIPANHQTAPQTAPQSAPQTAAKATSQATLEGTPQAALETTPQADQSAPEAPETTHSAEQDPMPASKPCDAEEKGEPVSPVSLPVSPVSLPVSLPVSKPDPATVPGSAPAATPAPSQSYVIGGRYEVDSVIGKGTFGPTYKARDIATDRMLCLKMVSTPISRHRRIVKRIMQEVEKSKTLNHAHIVAIYDSGIDKSGRPFYVMDLVDQGSLKRAIRQEGFLDVPEVIDIFLDVCEALGYAHEHGILHRDLKPSNILLSGEMNSRRAKVCDFGIIKALPSVGSEALEMTQSTDVFADPSCMSPEQCLGRRLDARSDIYSLGCSMFEAIIGKRVFSGPNPLSIVVQHFKAAPRRFDSVMYNCDISEDVEAVVMRMLEKSPDDRYQEIIQVVEDLKLLKAHRKPNFAYQKKRRARSFLAFGTKKGDADSPEKMFDAALLNNQLWLEDKGWEQEQKPQVAVDLKKLAGRKIPPQQPARGTLAEEHNTSDAIVEIKRLPAPPDAIGAEAKQHLGDEIWAQEAKKPRRLKEEVILPGRMKLPQYENKATPNEEQPNDSGESSSAKSADNPFANPYIGPSEKPLLPSVRQSLADPKSEPRQHSKGRAEPNFPVLAPEAEREPSLRQRSLLPIYRASDSYPENGISLFCHKEEDENQPIVTVEQAKRQIPEYLLQVSRPTNQSPVLLVIVVIVTIVLILQFIASLH